MISAIAELGKKSLKQSGKDLLDILTHPINQKKYPHLLILNVNSDSVTVHLEENDEEKEPFLLFRKGPGANSSNYSPVAVVTEWEKTFQNKVLRWFEWVFKQKESFSAESISFIEPIYQRLIESKSQLLTLMKQKGADLKGGVVLVLTVNQKYPRQVPPFVDIFKKLIELKNNEITSPNQTCSVCGLQKPVVMAGTSVFKFYTTDKPGFIASGFREQDSWRNYPVCSDCNLHLQEGRQILEQHLRFRFCGIPYLLVPEFLFQETDEQSEILEILMDQKKSQSLKTDSLQVYLTSEDEIFSYLQETSDHLMFHLLFLKQVQSAERILLLLDDILPSRLRTLFEAKRKVEERFLKKDTHDTLSFHFGRIRPFFFKSDKNKREPDLDTYFLQIVESVFHGKPISQNFVIQFFIKELRNLLIHESPDFFPMSVNAVMSMEFFYELNLMRQKEGWDMKSEFEPFFQRFQFYDSPEKQGLFLLGALTQLLLRLQQEVRKAQPFLQQLKGYKMLESDFRGLLPKVLDKFNQYKNTNEYAKYARSKDIISQEVSRLLSATPAKWKLSVNEMNYCFVTGMSMSYQVTSFIHGTKNKEEAEC